MDLKNWAVMPAKDVGVVIQARMGSSRLPGKVMRDLNGQPLLGYLLSRLMQFDLYGAQFFVATTDREEDEEIAKFCAKLQVNCILGSELNVFSRYQKVARETKLKHIVRLTADNPLIDEKVLQFALQSHLYELPDLSTTRKIVGEKVVERYVPKGYSVDVINCQSLLNIPSCRLTPFEKEHVIPRFFCGSFKVNYLKPEFTFVKAMTVDTLEELENVRTYVRKKDG